MSFDIEKGKKRFLALLNEISSERKGIEPLVAWLEKGDFFSAPLTANQRGAYKGGLLEHSLNVYMAYMMLFAQDNDPFSSVVLITLLHKLCRCGYFKLEQRTQLNEKGKWEQVPTYVVEDKFPLGGGEKSIYLIERFVRLKPEEAIAIRWHMGGLDALLKIAVKPYPLPLISIRWRRNCMQLTCMQHIYRKNRNTIKNSGC